MSQLLHIFRKDMRHHWIEILATVALLTAYTWHVIYQWGQTGPPTGLLDVLWKAVMVLVPVSWCLLVIRTIQDENLVGDRQFWITRPYDWRLLAGAKLLSAVMFIHVPLFIAQVIMLDYAGFPAIHYLKGLLWIQMLIFLAVVLTSAVAAVVTSTIVQILLSIVGLVLYGFGMAGLSSLFPDSDMPSSTAVSDYWSYAVLGSLALLVIVVQYRWRKTWVSRLAIFGAAFVGALMLALMGLIPNPTGLAQIYPLPGMGQQPPVRLELRAKDLANAKKVEPAKTGKKVSVSFDFAATNVKPGTTARLDGATVTIQVPNGPSWNSHWIGRYSEFWPGEVITSLPVQVDRKFFEQNQNTPVNVHVVFALTGYRESDIREVIAQPGEFPVAGLGTCWTGEYYGGSRLVGCRAPLQRPSFIGRVDSSASTCTPTPSDDPSLVESLYTFNPNDDADPAELGIIPVQFINFYFVEPFTERPDSGRRKSPLSVCNGTPFTLARPEIFQHTRTEAELDGVKLSDYVAAEYRFAFP